MRSESVHVLIATPLGNPAAGAAAAGQAPP
jgi:hypothetical protein